MQQRPLGLACGFLLPKPAFVVNGLKKPGAHDAYAIQRVIVIDGQQQQVMTSEGLWQGNLRGIGQDSYSHFNALHTTEGYTFRFRQEPWKHIKKRE